MNPSYATEGTFDPNGMVVGDDPVTRTITVANSAALTAGAVLGMVTASGKYLLSDEAAVDGSQVARAILAQDADASAGDAVAVIYDAGQFDEAKLNFGGTRTADTVREELRAVGIHLKKVQA